MDFSNRSYEMELLDNTNVPFIDIKRNLQELEFINKHLGGHRGTIKGLINLLPEWVKLKAEGDTLFICEIGCGGGDNLKAIDKWCSSKDIKTRFLGIDINKECITYAKENSGSLESNWIINDYRVVEFEHSPDIIFSSLFCHHFTDEELTSQFLWMKNNSRVGFFINDLHRHKLAYYSIALLTKLFSRSYLVKNDAPLSVKRGFKKIDLINLCQSAGIRNYSIQWQWAFRWLVIVRNEEN